MNTPEKIISDDEIIRVHAYANFGAMTPREVVNDGVMLYAIGYTGGSTQVAILREHGLIKKPRTAGYRADLTEKGKRYARSIYQSAQTDPIGAAWMREQAPNTVAYSERLISEDNRIWIDERPYVCEETAYRAIRAIPLPTDADLLAEAMKLPEVAALVAAVRRQIENVERWLETGTPAGPDESKSIYDAMTSALAPFTAAKEAANG